VSTWNLVWLAFKFYNPTGVLPKLGVVIANIRGVFPRGVVVDAVGIDGPHEIGRVGGVRPSRRSTPVNIAHSRNI